MNLSDLQLIGPSLIVAGAGVAFVGYLRVLAQASSAGLARSSDEAVRGRDLRWTPSYVLLAVMAVGFLVRLIALDAKGISHPEAYIPGLDLPANISEPPPRHGFMETLEWHFHSEPHPFGYFLAMWAWTKVFGASLISIRAPEAILGASSIFLIYRVGLLSYGHRVGIIAAALLSLHGFHIFWSQAARMYAPGGFLGLLSTWLLLELAKRREPHRLLEGAYVASLVAGAFTVEFTWPLLAVHMLWTTLKQSNAPGTVSRLSVLQALAAILAAPILSHAIMTGRNGAAEPPTLQFLQDYFSFGFAFNHGAYSEAALRLSPALSLVVLAFSLVLLGLGLRRPTEEPVPEGAAASNWFWRLGLAMAGVGVLMIGLMAIAHLRRALMGLAIMLPLLALAIPIASAKLMPSLRAIAPRASLSPERAQTRVGLVTLLALLPTVAIFLISFKVTLTAPRAFLIFVPYLLVLIAAGFDGLSQRRPVRAIVGAALLATFIASAVMLSRIPISPTDYRGLATAINANLRPGDLIFTPAKHWGFTPFFLYLPPERLVAERYREAIRAAPNAGVWVLFPQDEASRESLNALAGYRAVKTVTALRASATLYAPTPSVR